MGLGLLGRSLGDALFLAEHGAVLTITDLKTEEMLAPSLEKLKPYSGITYVLGEHRLEDFQQCDMVIKAPGVPFDSPYIKEAQEHNIPVEMDASLFLKLAPEVISIGVTGTRGKSVTTQLIFEILKADEKRVFLGGNVRGIATLPLIEEVQQGDYVVLELDSWQLQGFGDAGMSPHVAVFTTFMRDHMNYYKGDMERYFADKAHIFQYQTKSDILVVGEDIADRISSSAKKFVATSKDIPGDWDIQLLGDHNRKNAAIAIAVAKALGISEDVIRSAIESFRGLAGRLEYIGEKKGIFFYNDTTATTPDAALAALDALENKHIVLITGGADKDLEYAAYAARLSSHITNPVFFKGSATQKLISLLPKTYAYTLVDTMPEAVKEAYSRAEKGDVVLLSPGAASFELFENEYDRGDQFVQCVNAL